MVGILTVTSGCTGAPDRSTEADALEAAITAMPGVEDASVSYENNFERGAAIYVNVYLPGATRQQVVDLVNRYVTVRGDDFDRFYQRVTFQVAESRGFQVVCGAELDPATIADEATVLRTLSTRIKAGGADWGCGPQNRTLAIHDNDTPVGQVLNEIHAAGGDPITAVVEIGSAASTPSAMAPFRIVDVTFPFGVDDWNRFGQLVSRLGVVPWTAAIGPGSAVAGLSVSVAGPATAERQLESVIAAVGAGPDHPLNLRWALADPPPYDREVKRFEGSVRVGACSDILKDVEGEKHPERYFTPEARDVQTRLRERYEICGR